QSTIDGRYATEPLASAAYIAVVTKPGYQRNETPINLGPVNVSTGITLVRNELNKPGPVEPPLPPTTGGTPKVRPYRVNLQIVERRRGGGFVPVQQAQIIVSSGKTKVVNATSDNSGEAEVALYSGTYPVRVDKAGYKETRQSIVSNADLAPKRIILER